MKIVTATQSSLCVGAVGLPTVEPKSSSSWTALATGQATRQVTFGGIQLLYALSTKGKRSEESFWLSRKKGAQEIKVENDTLGSKWILKKCL